jgi:hypothetical protein
MTQHRGSRCRAGGCALSPDHRQEICLRVPSRVDGHRFRAVIIYRRFFTPVKAMHSSRLLSFPFLSVSGPLLFPDYLYFTGRGDVAPLQQTISSADKLLRFRGTLPQFNLISCTPTLTSFANYVVLMSTLAHTVFRGMPHLAALKSADFLGMKIQQ